MAENNTNILFVCLFLSLKKEKYFSLDRMYEVVELQLLSSLQCLLLLFWNIFMFRVKTGRVLYFMRKEQRFCLPSNSESESRV